MRDMTKEESEAYEKYLSTIYKPTGVNFNDLMDDKEKSDLEKFKNFFDEIGIGYDVLEDAGLIHLSGLEVASGSLDYVDIDIRFWPDGSYERFEIETYD